MRIIHLLLVAILLTACATKSMNPFKEFKPPHSRTENELFQAGESALSSGYYDIAIRQFEMISNKYPYSKHSEQSQLNLIYAYQKSGQGVTAVDIAERFIRFYPRSEHIDYAYYMRAVANFEQDRGLLFGYLPIDWAERDLSSIKQSFEQFSAFLRRFPKSQYAGDARLRMIHVRNLLAAKEWNIASFYYDEKRYLAAVNRLNILIKNYPEAPQIEKSLVLLIEANLKLQQKEPARQAYAILRVNFPNSPSLAKFQRKV
jgi:outer membrane protein assembly factor BamD